MIYDGKTQKAVVMRFAEFFAGGGMVSEALKASWTCAYGNDICSKKAESFFANHGKDAPLTVKSIEHVCGSEVPDVDLMWGSFPCQDVSLAGNRVGLAGHRSGMFFEFFRVVKEMQELQRAPRILTVENVIGLQRSNGGDDLKQVLRAFKSHGYDVGFFELNALHFLPQSRPRLFVVGVKRDLEVPLGIATRHGGGDLTWNFHVPRDARVSINDIMENSPTDVEWHDPARTQDLVSMMSPVNLAKVRQEVLKKGRSVGFIYKRTRIEQGIRVQRAEVRFDGVAGCLRTPGGGSSRQLVMIVENGEIRSRLLSKREAARLMGLPDSYVIPNNYNQAYHLMGDGVAVPVVKHIAEQIFEPILENLLSEAA